MTEDRSLTLSVIAVTLLLGAAIVATSLLPIYPDEVAYKIFLERYWLNGGFRQSVTPYCAEGFLYTPPLLLRPAAIFWTIPYFLGTGWASYRLLPLLALLGFLFCLGCVGWRARDSATILSVALVGSGATLFGLVVFRPEVFILFFSLLLFLLFFQMTKTPSQRTYALSALVATFIFSLICYLHPKAIYLTPFVFVGFGLAALKQRKSPTAVAVAAACVLISMLITAQSVQLHQATILRCAEHPVVASAMKQQSINILESFSSVENLTSAIWKLISPHSVGHALMQLGFSNTPDAAYLPKPPPAIRVYLAQGFALAAMVGAFAFCSVTVLRTACRLRQIERPETVLVSMLWLGLVVPYILNLQRHWYDAAAFSGGLAMTTVLFLAATAGQCTRKTLATLSMLAATTSIAVVLTFHAPSFARGYSGPGISLGIDRAAVDRTVRTLLQKYNVPPGEPLIIDDLTYEAAKTHRIVLPITYLGVGMTRSDIVTASLDRLGAKYGITRTPMLSTFENFRILETLSFGPGQDESISIFTLGPHQGDQP